MTHRENENKNSQHKSVELYVDRFLFLDHETQAPTAIAQIGTKKPKKPATWLRSLLAPSWQKESRKIRSKEASVADPKRLVFTSAKKLLNYGLKYDSIRLLYEFAYYKEAADILRNMGANADAARLYVKAKRWEQAEICFAVQQDRLNAARCAQAAGKYSKAAPVFEEFEDWHSAARCQRRMGDWRRAAHNFASAGRNIEATRCWHEWIRLEKNKPSSQQTELTAVELRGLVKLLTDEKPDAQLLHLIETHAWEHMLVVALVKRGKMMAATQLYQTRYEDISHKLCEWAARNPEASDSLLELCHAVNDERGVATLLEQTERLHEAVEAWEAMAEYEKAYKCALKCNWQEKIITLRTQHTASLLTANMTGSQKPGSLPSDGTFALSSLKNATETAEIPSISLMSQPKPVTINSRVLTLDTQSHNASPAFTGSKLFHELSGDDRRRLWDVGSVVSYKAGDIVIDIGQIPTSTFTVISGEVKVYRLEGHFEREVDSIKAGHNFGESWLLVDLQSKVRIVAGTECEIHIIERTGFTKLTAPGAPNAIEMVSRLAQAVCSHLLGSIAGGRH